MLKEVVFVYGGFFLKDQIVKVLICMHYSGTSLIQTPDTYLATLIIQHDNYVFYLMRTERMEPS